MPAGHVAPRFITVRNRSLSLWQSAVRAATQELKKTDPDRANLMRYAAGLHAEATVKRRPIPVPPPPLPGEPLSLEQHIALSKAHFDAVRARARGDLVAEADAVAVIRDYSNWDVNWSECELYYAAWYAVLGQPPIYRDWVNQTSQLNFSLISYQLPSSAKILLIGDWGTGMTDAVAMLKAGVEQFKPDAILHLGDVYYSGIPDECQEHVIDVITNLRTQTGLALPFFTIPGNHEYYSGGAGFYEMIDKINSGIAGAQQQASYFCLRSADSNWQFLAMDTGYGDHDPNDDAFSSDTRGPSLHSTELVWHYDKIDNFSGSTILLSHHQLYSAFSEINGNAAWGPAFLNQRLYNSFVPKFGRTAAWFWGHEHNFAQYPDQLGVQNCRLAGCSAYEEAKNDDPYDYQYKQIKYGPLPNSTKVNQVGLSPHTTATRTFYNHMFALMTLNPAGGAPGITVDYYQYPSWDQDYDGKQPATAQSLCSETVYPAQPAVPTAETKAELISINGANVLLSSVGVSLTRYRDWLVAAYPGSNSSILYMFGDAAGWNGNRALKVIEATGVGSDVAYSTTTSPAVSPGPDGRLYCAFQQAGSSGALCWGATIANSNHLYWNPAQQASIQGRTQNIVAGPALAFDETNDMLFAVYPVASPTAGTSYINYAYLTYEGGQPQWFGNQTIPFISGIGIQPYINSSGWTPGAIFVGEVLYVAFTPSSYGQLYLIWGVRDAAKQETIWQGSQAVVNGAPVKPNSSPTLAVLGGRIVVTYIAPSSSQFTTYVSQCNFDPQTSSWAGNEPFSLSGRNWNSFLGPIGTWGEGQTLSLCFTTDYNNTATFYMASGYVTNFG
jgi:hypothetical protein